MASGWEYPLTPRMMAIISVLENEGPTTIGSLRAKLQEHPDSRVPGSVDDVRNTVISLNRRGYVTRAITDSAMSKFDVTAAGIDKNNEMADYVKLRLTKYNRGTKPIKGYNTPMVGYRVRCSCGFEQRNNAPKHETMRDVVRPHLKEVHGLVGQEADKVIS